MVKQDTPESDENGEVSEMLDKFEEIKEQRERSLSPVDVVDHLPSFTTWDGNRLKINIENRPWNTEGAITMGLTTKKKKILRALADGMSPCEIVSDGIASDSYIAKTRKGFNFLLEDPMLYDAFVERSLKSSKDYRVEGPDGEFNMQKDSLPQALEAAERFVESTGKSPVIRHPDGHAEVYETQEQKAQSFESGDSMGAFDDEDWKKVVGALHRDNQDELASFIIDEVM